MAVRVFTRSLELIHRIHIRNQVQNFVTVSPLVVIPAHELDKLIVEGDTGFLVEDGGAGIADEVGGYDSLVGESQDALHRAFGGGKPVVFRINYVFP